MSRRDWFPGLVIGAWSGFLLVYGPVVGVALFLAFGVPALVRRSTPAIGGLLVGSGATILTMLGLAQASCLGLIGMGDGACTPPDLTGWLLVGSAMATAGLALSVSAARAGSRRGR